MLQKRPSEKVNAAVLLLLVGAGRSMQTDIRKEPAEQEHRSRERKNVNATTQ